MSERSRRGILRAAGTTIIAAAAAGCMSSTPSGAENTTTRTTTTNAQTSSATPSPTTDFGPWGVTVDNNLDETSTVTLKLMNPDDTLHKQHEVTVDGGDGESVISITESGHYTLKASTEFDSDTADIKACKLNSGIIVELYTNNSNKALTVSQRHTDPGATNTIEDPYSCD
jgi:hypothetical protein